MGKSTSIKRFELSGVENKGPKLRKKQCLLFFAVVVIVFFFLAIKYAFLPNLIC